MRSFQLIFQKSQKFGRRSCRCVFMNLNLFLLNSVDTDETVSFLRLKLKTSVIAIIDLPFAPS